MLLILLDYYYCPEVLLSPQDLEIRSVLFLERLQLIRIGQRFEEEAHLMYLGIFKMAPENCEIVIIMLIIGILCNYYLIILVISKLTLVLLYEGWILSDYVLS